MSTPILEAVALGKVFGATRGWFGHPAKGSGFHAVRNVSFSLARGETLGIVGESGSGKSTTARMLLRLVEPTSGTLRLDGENLLALDAENLRRRRRGIQMVFQDPFSSLNPRLTVGAQVGEPMLVHELASRAAIGERVARLLGVVGLDPSRASAYPHEFSGGQRQRIAIARALAAEPKLIVADEAVSALDVSVRAQILNLLDDLKRASDLALVFISHDLGVVRHLVDRIAVMYRGRIVEMGPTEAIFSRPRHPYTRALLSAMPVARVGARRARAAAAAPETVEEGEGCAYASRCPLAAERCRRDEPSLELHPGGHASACHHWKDVPPLDAETDMAKSPAAERLRRLQSAFAEGRPAMAKVPA
jgi:peptide/nickel transport system ATP-binding protein/oligopeptide transport system ATP-binding protein